MPPRGGRDGTATRLWHSDGARARLVTTVARDVGSIVVLGTRVVFTAADDSAGNEIWVSDGTAGGTSRLKDIRRGPEAASRRA